MFYVFTKCNQKYMKYTIRKPFKESLLYHCCSRKLGNVTTAWELQIFLCEICKRSILAANLDMRTAPWQPLDDCCGRLWEHGPFHRRTYGSYLGLLPAEPNFSADCRYFCWTHWTIWTTPDLRGQRNVTPNTLGHAHTKTHVLSAIFVLKSGASKDFISSIHREQKMRAPGFPVQRERARTKFAVRQFSVCHPLVEPPSAHSWRPFVLMVVSWLRLAAWISWRPLWLSFDLWQLCE